MAGSTDSNADRWDMVAVAAEGSTAIALIRRTASALPESHLATIGSWFVNAIRNSFLYRWLTKEPDPDVIVIDLRETYTVRPVIALIDWLITWLVPASQSSAIVVTTESLQRYVGAAPVRAASLVLGIAVLTNLTLTVVVGTPTQAGVLARVVLLGIAGLGTRVSLSWPTLLEIRAIQFLVAIREPPEPPNDGER